MSYSFCFGPSGSGKSHFLRRMVIGRARKSLTSLGRDRTKYIVIVPEQYTLLTQKELILEDPGHVLMNIDVLSFGRLAHRVFEETLAGGRPILDDIGKSLLLRRAASACAGRLQVLGRGIHKPGMIDEIKSVLSEFMQYGIGEAQIQAMAAYAGDHGRNALKARLEDMKELCGEFSRIREDRFVTAEETLDILAGAIPGARSLKGAVIIFDGFTGFTTVQYRVIRELMRCAGEVFFSFTVSGDRGPDIGITAAGGPEGSQEDLFYMSRKTVRDIVRMGKEEGFERGQDFFFGEEKGGCGEESAMRAQTPVSVSGNTGRAETAEVPVPGRTGLPRFQNSRVLAHLEKHLFRYPEVPFSEREEGETGKSLRIFTASSPREEVSRIFADIQETIAKTGCAYRDFAIVTADLETYGSLFELEASRSGIPVYIDRASGAFHNILIEGIRSVLQISSDNFSHASVFRYLRSGLSRLSAEEVDLLENYCLANGVRGRKKWSMAFDASCEEIRLSFLREVEPVTGKIGGQVREIADPVPGSLSSVPKIDPEEEAGSRSKAPADAENSLRPGQTSTSRRARTTAERTREVYDFLVNVGAQGRMAQLSARFGADGDAVREKHYGQIYQKVIDMLDQLYVLAGQERISAADYLELVEAGLSQIRLGTIPQQVDRVLVGDIERTRLAQIDHLFIAGVNEGSIPRSSSRGGLLSDMDREFLALGGIVLGPSPRQQMFIQRLYLYMNMTKPSHTLTLSFASVSQDGRSLRPSYLISMLRALFPAAVVEFPEMLPAASRIGDRAGGRRLLAVFLRKFVEGTGDPETFPREFSLLYGFHTSPEVMADPEVRRQVRMLREAALFRYRPRPLSPEIVRSLYGKMLFGGISRMETGARCLLRHHLRYGLRLKERDIYEFASADAGTILHASLQLFDGLLRSEGLSWNDFSRDDATRLVRRALREEVAGYRNLLLFKTARDEGRIGRLERRLLRTVDTLQYQLRKGDFVPVAAELGFGGKEGDLPPIRFDLGKGRTLAVIGRIDRVDLCEDQGRRYIKIMDYKSGKNDLDPRQIRRGLQLQLITYMQALVSQGQGLPAAMLYYRMDDPVIEISPETILTASHPRDPDSQGREPAAANALLQSEEERRQTLKKLRPTGLVLEDDAGIGHLDRTFTAASDVIPVTRLKKGGYNTSASKIISPEEYGQLAEEASLVLCRIAEEILDGEIAARPAVIDQKKTACDYCPYRGACGFDLRLPGYERRR